MKFDSIQELNDAIVNCIRCERLVKFRSDVSQRNSRFANEEFWSKPVPGFGDIGGRILILGLAPAATGGNRTGRVFTGDKSSDFLVSCLYEAGITNIPTSESRDDGLEYNEAYITAILKCVPPNDKPLRIEMENCSEYLEFEIDSMKNLRVILTLGSVAHSGLNRYLKNKGHDVKGKKFSHGKVYEYDGFKEVCSYHPSPRNVNTGRLTRPEFLKVLETVKNESSI